MTKNGFKGNCIHIIWWDGKSIKNEYQAYQTEMNDWLKES